MDEGLCRLGRTQTPYNRDNPEKLPGHPGANLFAI